MDLLTTTRHIYGYPLTEVWCAGRPVRKSDALHLMRATRSPHGAGQYLEDEVR